MDKILSVSRSFFERYRNKIAFFMLCVSIFSFAFVALKNFDNLKVPYFNGIYDDVVINIETPDLDGIPIWVMIKLLILYQDFVQKIP